MQTFIQTIRADGGRGVAIDAATGRGVRPAPFPTCSMYTLRALVVDASMQPVDLSGYASFALAIAHDFDGATAPECVALSVSLDPATGELVAVCNPATEEMAAAIRVHAANGRLGATVRVLGYDSSTAPVWSCSWPAIFEGEAPAGNDLPTSLADNYYTKAQILALLDGIDPESAKAAIEEAVSTHNADKDAHSALFAGKADASHTHTVSDITGFGVSWGDVTDKPASFTPSAHTHSGIDVHYAVTAIPAADTTYTLSDGGNYTHSPSSAPIYTLPAVTDEDVAHEITIEVKFSAGALSVAFYDNAGAIVAPMSNPTISANSVITFLCRWSIGKAKWCIMPVEMA